MVSQYSMGAYPQNYPQMYPQQQSFQQMPENYEQMSQKSSFPSTIGMMTVGAVGGGTVGYLKNRHPIAKNGKASDSFVKEVFKNHIKTNMDTNQKEFFEQINNVLAKIDKIKDVESFKKLLTKNKMVLNSKTTGLSLETFINSLTPDNLKESKKSLKEILEKGNAMTYQTIKNYTEKCWDKEAKKFVKPEEVSSKIFDVIKKTKTKNQWKKALKYGGISAGVLGALTIGYKMFVGNN